MPPFSRCDPVVCDVTDYHGSSRSIASFGRKKRSAEHDLGKDDDVMVAGVIHISDQFEQLQTDPANEKEWSEEEEGDQEINCTLQKQEFQQDTR